MPWQMLYSLASAMPSNQTLPIGFLGGTGPEGRGLALRLALAGYPIIIGSRESARADQAVRRMEERASVAGVRAATNDRVVDNADTVFLTVPYDAQAGLLEPLAGALAGKTVVCTVAPITFEDGQPTAVQVPEGSAAAQVQRLLPGAKVVAAFQNVSAVDLWAHSRILEGDVVVCSDHPQSKEQVMALAERIPSLRAVDGGPLLNARYVEELTALLLNINRIHKARTMVRFVGLEDRS